MLDYIRKNRDMSFSPNIESFLLYDKNQKEEIGWLGEEIIENVVCRVGIRNDNSGIVVMAPHITFSICLEDFIAKYRSLE